MRIRLELDAQTTQALIRSAVSEKRPVAWQAEILLRRALGLPFPETGKEGGGDAVTQD